MNLNYFFEIFKNADASVWIGIVIFILIVLLIILRMFRKSQSPASRSLTSSETSDSSYEKASEGILVNDSDDKEQVKVGPGLPFRCLCFRKIKGVAVADFTSMSEPVGELYQFDPSCPVSGSGYIVRQLDNGVVEDYDPREVKMLVDDTPDHAWHAINWKDDVNSFWTVPIQWWKNTANWYAAGVLCLALFTMLVVLG